MRSPSINNLNKHYQGFTLVELIIVIVLLGILSIGVTGFIRLGSEMFVDTKNRSDMVATGRFVTERLNRELRAALPNSIEVLASGTIQCIVHTPIITTANYLDIPTISENESATKSISVVAFDDLNIIDGFDYRVAVYPTSSADVYTSSNNKIERLESITKDKSNTTATNQQWDVSFDNNILFATDSPTLRLYFINEKVSYCVLANDLKRFEGNNPIDNGSLITFFNSNGTLMANNLLHGNFPFRLAESTQFRNATVLIQLILEKSQEEVIFNNEVHIPNAP